MRIVTGGALTFFYRQMPDAGRHRFTFHFFVAVITEPGHRTGSAGDIIACVRVMASPAGVFNERFMGNPVFSIRKHTGMAVHAELVSGTA